MMSLCCKVLDALQGKTLVTAESCTGGGIGAALTAVAGSSKIYKGGIICYTDWVKNTVLGIDQSLLERYGAVSAPVAEQMALCAAKRMEADVAVSVTGIAGPDTDAFENPVGTVYIGLCAMQDTQVRKFMFDGDREAIRQQAIRAALIMILEYFA